ncbi:MAG: spore cortex biosynthesis protein YabQ [Lachnospiraceae bacterium]|nr:spore cortex biosynthesis protein YabQ [Lachnospiraceae bacterium]MCM1240416.1 spore cortex biosynthesis protein YabQ [Lachnospiraceae bacterium]MCM1303134.1 spore cortex biosynthesis protein YabQ [Butyrivibrio sp.]MCM1342803.1 spore cortex biosynthesis protein YabQ [Muribaculaceae bacterium]MCM1409933.1 spore cortex biosynthesis protein YabQ [Lachnospiraceae bacterium]
MASENEFLLHALLMGIFITFVYDILRILRRAIPHSGFVVSLEDLGFWIFCAEKVFLMMYHESNGNLRWFAVIGALVGMLLYRKLVSSWFVKYVSLGLEKALGVLMKAAGFLCRPFRAAGARAGAAAGAAGNRFRRLLRGGMRRIKKKLTFFLKVLKCK